jgi:hypothetical protein
MNSPEAEFADSKAADPAATETEPELLMEAAEPVSIPPNLVAPLWKQLPGEPVLWYTRFNAYRKLGPARSFYKALKKCHADEGKDPARLPEAIQASWWAKSKTWRWHERAHAWDLHLIEEDLAEEDIARKQARVLRRDMMLTFQEKVHLILLNIDPSVPVPLRDASGAFRTIVEELRAEFGDSKPQRVQVSSPAGEALHVQQDVSADAVASVIATLIEAGVIPTFEEGEPDATPDSS